MFIGFGLHIQVTVGFYVDLKNADTGFTIRNYVDEIILTPDKDTAVVIKIIQKS